METNKPLIKPFRANAHLLKLLGDELIGDDRLAVFELVKNAYDANATSVDVTLNLECGNPNIIIWDHCGFGMTENDILNKWMEIGTNSKRSENKVRTPPPLSRLPLGEKGVGRLAVHKLGKQLTINTKAENSQEYKITINWPKLIEDAEYIEDTRVTITPLEKPEFFEYETGTRIEIGALNNTHWTRGDLRRLKRLLTSLISPFKTVSDFNVNLSVPKREKDLADLLEAQDILDKALWTYDFIIDEDGKFSSNYSFNPPQTFKELAVSSCEQDDDPLELLEPSKEEELARDKDVRESLLLKSADLEGIGPISGTFYIFMKTPAILSAVGSPQLIKEYLKEQSGVRVYRDGIRVFNYGEGKDDWLGLNAGRINMPGKKIDTGMVIGGIDLNLETSSGLKEKTNREGFDDNDTYKRYRWIVASVIEDFHIKHREDREALDEYLKGDIKDASPATTRFAESIDDVKKSIKKHGLEEEMSNKVAQIESDYYQMREVTLSSGIAGINLAVIFHEVERGVDDLNESIRKSDDYDTLLKRAEHLAELLEGFAPLLRRNEQKTFDIKALTQKIIQLNQHRFMHHNVAISCPINSGESESFKITAPYGLLQATLSNLIDNSIHWTKLKSEIEGDSFQPAIRIDSLPNWFKEGPALIVMDNGPGFSLTAEEAIQPFKTSRPGGMGVGLYYSDKVMETIGGRLQICDPEDLDLPEAYQGAAVVMIFARN
ncbi:ATP-binding protein [Vibrio quintilis]|uniref:C4-dicarboxylate transport sensor protein DctB n=1 Tax=Vibrio quintilis TaxID=1117707 RepID=A0A1M7YSI5_9VIBR|nr:ATP-binding protein [Vibrio quintilis]SHO55580.1 C4-dicarboxylate transport sensor protein DctB [Vibrio quintilis]